MISGNLRKYRKIYTCTLKDQLHYLPAFMVHNIFFIVILFVFFSLWTVVYSSRELVAGLSLTQLLWYICFTESIELSKSRTFVQIQDEVKDGSIAYALCRPYSYVLFTLVKALAEASVRIGPILCEGILVAYLLIGPLPGLFLHLPAGILLILLGIVLVSLWNIIIGLLAFWAEEVSPFYWILQKVTFILGGLFFPIDFFPEWIQGTAHILPFAFSAYWPAISIVNFSWESFRITLGGQCIYIAVLLLLAMGLYRKAILKMHVQGG